MAAPLVKGRALAQRRVSGVVFLIVISLLVGLTIAIYQKRFTETVEVSLETDRVGNQLSVHADVKVRGLVVGEVRKISSNGERAVLELALDPDKIALVPRNVSARLLPKTLFGEKEVSLIVPDAPSSESLRGGDVISQDRSSAALETETALNNLLPLLKSLEPQQVSITLNALADGLRGRGDLLGRNLATAGEYFASINPALPTLAQDMQGLADFTGTVADATPNLLTTLDNFSFSGRSLVEQQAALDGFLQSTRTFADSATTLVADNERRLVDLARDSLPSLQLYASYSNYYPCMFSTLSFQQIEGERVFGGLQPGLHITVEVIEQQGGYRTGDEPKYRDTYNPGCYGLLGDPIRPFPEYRNAQDGYRDSDPPRDPEGGPKAGWMSSVTASPSTRPTRTRTMPADTSMLDALLLAPLTGTFS